MITFFRRTLSNPIILGLLGLVLIAFIVTGVGDPFGGPVGGGSNVARVGKANISDLTVRRQLDRNLAVARQDNPQIDAQSFVRSPEFDMLIDQLVFGEAMEQWGEKIGITASPRMVDGEIASIQAFQLAGKFDQTTYEAALARQKMTDRELRDGLHGDIIRRQLLVPVSAAAYVPKALARPYAALLLEERQGSIGLVPSALFVDKAPPTDADVEAYYRANTARYRIPERRVLRYALFGPAQARAAEPSAADIQKYYAANRANYAGAETRKLSQIVLPSQQEAQALVKRVRAGEGFEKIASERGFSASDIALGEQTKTAFSSATAPAVADAAFAAAKGGVTDPVQSDFGWHIVRVDDVLTRAGKSLAEASAEIAETLRKQKREEAMADLVARIEDGIAEGKSFADTVTAEKLTMVTTPAIVANGRTPDDPAWQAPAELAALLKPGFELGAEDDPVVEDLHDGNYALLQVGQVIAAAPAPLARIKQMVTLDLMRSRASEKAAKAAADILAKIKAGTPMAKAFADAKMPPVQSAGGKRMDLARQQQVPPPLAMMFTMAEGSARRLTAPNDQGFFIVRLDKVIQGDIAKEPGLLTATQAQFSRLLGEEYATQFARAVARDIGVKRDDKAIKRLRDELGGATPAAE